jgi:hypothetical protein
MTDYSLESRPTTDGELREQLVKIFAHISDELVAHDAVPRSAYHLDLDTAAVNQIMRLIKQNTPSKESVLPKSSSQSEPDSSIPDDDSLQSQPQQPDSTHTIIKDLLWKNISAEKAEALLAQREQTARINELTRLDNAYDEVTPERFHEYYIERVKSLAARRQDSEGEL